MQQGTHKTTGRQVAWRVGMTLMNLLVIAFIFYNSSQVGEVSGAFSARVLDTVNSLFSQLGLGIQISHYTLRKLGHVAEYMLLGFWLALSLRVYTRRLLAFMAWPLLGGLLVAVADEFFQSFVPGRSSRVADVLYDFAGVALGMVAALLLEWIVRSIWQAAKRRRHRTARQVPQ